MTNHIRRREFITLLGGAAAAWPLAAEAQQPARMRRVGNLQSASEDDPATQANLSAWRQELAKLGWIEGRNLRIELRHTACDPERMRASAAELLSAGPDVMVVGGQAGTRVVQQQTRTIPIVFVQVGDPVENGLVASLARPEGNTTGITNLYASIAGKWVELLREAAPHVARVAIVFNPDTAPESYLTSVETAALALGVPAIKTPVRNPLDVVRALDAFAAEPNGGVIGVPPFGASATRDMIIQLAAQHRLPSIYNSPFEATRGGMMAYGTDSVDLYRRAASYVDRILRGAKPGDLPVQYPTKFELVINLKTAKSIGLTIPEAFLLRADELIE
jgi:putative tryptophan/tyrosine transport system substrate-binding protein